MIGPSNMPRVRETFGKPIGRHQAIQFMLADAATEIQGTRLMIYWASWLKDKDKPYPRKPVWPSSWRRR